MSKVSDIVKSVAKYLAMDELLAAMDVGQTLSGELLAEQNDLVRCVNIAAADIALCVSAPTDYKLCTSIKGGIFYSDVDDNLIEVFDVRNESGKKVSYTVYSDRVLVEDGRYYVYFSYSPGKLTLVSEVPFSQVICLRALPYAVCAEYCVAVGLNGEAAKWHALFEKEREKIVNKKPRPAGIMSARRWF